MLAGARVELLAQVTATSRGEEDPLEVYGGCIAVNIGRAWGGILADRVVAIVTRLDTGFIQTGTGYLATERPALTARQCTADERTGRPLDALAVG